MKYRIVKDGLGHFFVERLEPIDYLKLAEFSQKCMDIHVFSGYFDSVKNGKWAKCDYPPANSLEDAKHLLKKIKCEDGIVEMSKKIEVVYEE